MIGQTGTGKSTLLLNLMRHDLETGVGFCFIDPHGEDAPRFLNYIPPERRDDVIYFDLADEEYPVAFNPLDHVPLRDRHRVMQGIVAAFRNMYPDSWSESRMAYLTTNIIAALLDAEDTTLLGIRRMLTDDSYCKEVMRTIHNRDARVFWYSEYQAWPRQYKAEASAAILNKVCQLFLSPLLVNILGQQKSAFSLAEVMNTNKILIVNLAQGRAGDRIADLIGSLFVTSFYVEAMRRPPEHRNPYHLYIDEFQNMTAPESFSRMLSGVRKFGLCLTLAHQYIHQLDDRVRHAIFGNVGTLVSFRVGELDAEHLDRAMPEEGTSLIYLANHHARVKRAGEEGLTMCTYPLPDTSYAHAEAIIAASRDTYGTARHEAEAEITKRWYPRSEDFLVRFDS